MSFCFQEAGSGQGILSPKMASFWRFCGYFSASILSVIAVPALAQNPGQAAKKPTNGPTLRAVAVLEWTGPAGKPDKCRIVPVSLYDGEQLQDAGLYLARPEPMAVAGEVEYELKRNGQTIGLFDVRNAGQEEGEWVGYGEWKTPPKPKPEAAAGAPAKVDVEDEDDDKPVLHRKKKSGDSSSAPSGGNAGTQSSPAPSDDPDRPKLHKKSDDSTNTGNTDDSDRPVLHKKTEDTSASNAPGSAPGSAPGTAPGSAPVDSGRPVMKKPEPQQQQPASVPNDALGDVTFLTSTDPDRPLLKRGRSNADTLKVLPSLMGLPPDMQQTVAISDAQSRPEHPWTFSWANPEDELKMKAQLEDTARQALGIATPAPAPAPDKAASAHRATASKKAKPAPPPPPAEPAPLEDEQFRVFELSYGAGATMVLSAHTAGPLKQEKFVTLIAQPDLYGNVLILFKSVTDGGHLDETPRMRLVDAVDALADNRGELLFELRSDTSRQFALYRVMRGQATKIFASYGGNFGAMESE
jgi:hypothetical protein